MTPTKTITATEKLRISRTFDAPRERVYRAWTDPEQMKRWFVPADGFATNAVGLDVRVGGNYRIEIKTPEGKLHVAVGTYREIKPPEKLVFTWKTEGDSCAGSEASDNWTETLVTIEFHVRGKATEVVLTHENFPNAESRDRHNHGWNGCLSHLGDFVTAKS